MSFPRAIATLLLTFVCTSCASVGASSTQSPAQVERGQTKEQVVQVLGQPADRQFDGENEALQYCTLSGNLFGTAYNGWKPGNYTVVWLLRGRVTGVTTYRRRVAAGNRCESAFDRIDWQQAPDPPGTLAQSDSVASERSRAEQGDAAAQYALGSRYANGEGVAVDHGQAAGWYRRSADQGYSRAEYDLAVLYSNGWGVPQDQREAARLYRRAAEQGLFNAQRNLAMAYLNGRGVPIDSAQAVKWFHRAAESDDDVSQFWLGILISEGVPGVSANPVEGVEWVRRAAEQGYAMAQVGLSYAYIEGIGVRMDYVSGYMWLVLGAEGLEREGSPIPPSGRAEIEAKLTPAQIEEGKRRAAAWRPRVP